MLGVMIIFCAVMALLLTLAVCAAGALGGQS
jgi:hypothetical protein